MASQERFAIFPVLGTKTNVPQNSPLLFKESGGGIATHDVGGQNFSLSRKRGACTKSQGFTVWSNTATATATNCQGLFRLDDGTNEDFCYWDKGKFYVFNATYDPVDVTGVGLTHQTANAALVCAIRVGSYAVFTGVTWDDKAGDSGMVQKWKHGDVNATLLIDPGGASGFTEYKFRYLAYFNRRIVGMHSDQTNGDIDIRYTAALPSLAGDVEFPAANQLYVPNDDSITGCATLGEQLVVYCKSSINQMAYYQDYTLPFRIFTAVPYRGCTGHHSIINLGDRHFLFNENYGFCDYAGGGVFPASGKPISDDIEEKVAGINPTYSNLIVGVFDPTNKRLIWTVPANGSTTPNQTWTYDLYTNSWMIKEYACRYIDIWSMTPTYTWNSLVAELGGTTSLWSAAGIAAWAQYASRNSRLVTGGTDGYLYMRAGEAMPTGENNGYRIEPILDFGDPQRKEHLQEIWFDIGQTSACDLDIYYRGGDTVAETMNAGWEALPALSMNDPNKAVVYLGRTNRYHQIKYGTDRDNELFQINKIEFVYVPQSKN